MASAYDGNSVHGGIDARVARLAASAFGLFTVEQLAALRVGGGVIQHRLRSGRWERAARGVYRLAGLPGGPQADLMAAILAWGEGAVASHRSAAWLWGLLGGEPASVELTVPRGRRRAAPGRIHMSALPARDMTTLGPIPLTTAARTLLDLAAVLPEKTVEGALDDALLRGVVRPVHIRAALERAPNRPGRKLLTALVADREGSAVPESVLESRLARAIRRAGLPPPVRQHRVTLGDRAAAVVDFAYPERRVAVEADGRRWHGAPRDWERDRARRNLLTANGWKVVHVTWRSLEQDEAAVVATIAAALAVKK